MKRLSFLFLFTLISSLSFGWGEIGHHIIAEIAKAHVNNNIQDSVNKYLGSMSWESAATWMDDMRRNKEYAYFKTWHYINIEKDMPYDSTKTGTDNVYVQLQTAINNLKNKKNLSPEQITYNLKILFHLMGDFHQPLHVGYGVDRGGNEIKVNFMGKYTNLHAIWDTDIIEQATISFENVNALSQKKIYKNMEEVNLLKWMTQTRKLLVAVYHFSNPIESKYIDDSKHIIQHQLLLAGLRLAQILTITFSV
ncbi:MAG TPA: S1/P1 nuclease [Bacteroidales bacterium]|nr:S1/P1 nuclease [Bacteroidales bacterium]